MAQAPPEPIARHSRSDGAADGIRHLRRRNERVEYERAPQHSGANARAVSSYSLERGSPVKAPDQADRRCRPLARRALMTARPPRVLMRARKPCFFARCRLLG